MREGTKRNALMLTALVLGALVGGNTASAANLVAAIPSDYAHSQLGSITGSKVTTHVDAKASAGDLTGLNQDPALYPLWVNGEGDLYLRQYTYSTTDLLNSRLINGQGEWDDTSAPSGKITAVANAHAAAGYNGYVYATGYDNGKIGAATLEGTELKENTDNVVNLKEDIIKYTADGAAAGYTDATAMHGEGLITTDDGYLYAAVNVNKQGGYDDYDNGYLMQYKIGSDGKLTYSSYSRIGKNTDSVRINQYNNQFVLSAIGGYQNFGSGNADTAITINKVASPGKLNPTSTVIRKPDYVPYDFRDVKVLPNGTVYILTYNIGDGGSAINSKVYKTTMANLTNGNKEQWEEIISGSQEGWFGKLNAEYYTKRLWLEMGNTLSVYTDGSTTPAYTWESKDFSTDQQFYQFNSVAMIPSDRINGDLVQLTMYNPEGLTSSSESAMEIINPDTSLATPTRHIEITGVEAKDKGTYASETTDYSTYTFTKDEVVGVGITRTGDLKNNISADIYASDGNDITVNAGDHTLTLWANNYVSSPVGVYAGKGKSVTINAAQTNIVTSGYENGNSLTNAIWNDAAKDAASSITINGDTNIAMKGGYGGNGIAIQKTDRWGEASNETTQTSKITLNGDVVIAGENEDTWGIPANKENVYSRFNNSGILTSVDKSEVTVTGNAKLSVYGNGITTNAKDSKVSIGGGHIVVPKNTNYGYYTLGAYQGTINVNTGTTGNSPGANTVQLDGDIFALDTGTVNAALTTADSYLNGIVDNGGTANVWLQNGAEWFNAANNTRYKNDNEDVGAGGKSLVTKLVGGTSESTAGNIFQNDSNPLTIDNYSGYANIYYAHTSDGTNASDYAAGDTVIKKAASGSAVNMITANNGINMQDTDQVAGALNTLAGKLTYSGFGNGENNLTGKVKIADGLTASSAALKTGDIVFSDGTGKGTYVKSDDNEGGAITETTTLTNDYTATASEKNVQGSGSSMLISALYAGSSETASKEKPMVVDMNGHNLTLNAQGDGGVASAIVLGANQSIQIKNSDSKKQLTLKASHPDDTRAVNGIYVGGNNSSLTIDNPVVIEALSNTGRSGVVGINVLGGGSAGSDSAIDVIINGPLTIKGASSKNISAQTPANAGIKTVANGSAVTVNGSVDIEHVKGAALYTVGADSTISVAGGSITAEANPEHDKNYSAVRVDKGTVNLNMEEGQPGSNVTNVVGDFYLTKEYGKKVVEYSGGELIDFENSGVINAAFTTGDSSWTGAMTYIVDKDDYGSGGYTAHDAGNFNLWLQNGAIWNNEVQGGITPDESQRNTFNGSHVLNFTGGTEGHEGNIFQKDAKTLTIDNYSGSTNIFYAHTDDGTTADDYAAGDTIINKAATGSAVNMITDSSNITTTDDEQVAAVLNTLAGKLTYSAFASGEKNLTGTVKIAEGLTASSAEVKTGDITFQESNGKGSYVVPSKRLIFNTPITGQDDIDTEYVNAGVLKNDLYTFDKDSQILISESAATTSIGTEDEKNVVGGILGNGNSINIDASGQDLSISSEEQPSDSQGIYGVYTNDDLTITADNLNINTTSTADNSADRGVLVEDGGVLTVNGNMNIAVNVSEDNEEYIYGINSYDYDGAGGKVTVNGKANIAIANAASGAAIRTENDANNDNVVTIESANITGPTDSSSSFLAIENVGGTINVGMNSDITASNGKDVTITGNVSDMYGVTNLGLGTKDSFLKGIISNREDMFEGTVNLYMNNGAIWINELKNNFEDDSGEDFAGSQVTNFFGGSSESTAGNIFQDDSNPLTIDNYSGYANIYYAHTNHGEDASDYSAGDTIIKKAKTGSAVTLITDNTGISVNDVDSVAKVLNSLAGKLTYSEYASGVKNLTGTVKIADGLTASSAEVKVGNITFQDSDGKGTYKSNGSIIPDSQTNSTFTTPITGNSDADTEYVNAGVLKNDLYTFTKDSQIVIAGDSDVTKVGYYKAVGGILGQNSNVTIDAAGKTLSISSVTPVAASEATYGAYTGKEAVVTADKLKIETVTNGNGNRGIFADSNASFTINGDADIKVSDTSNGSTYGIYSYRNANVSVNGDVTMKGDGTGDAQYGVYSASKPSYSMPTGIYTYSGKVNIKGNADLAVKGVAVDARSDGEIIIESANIVTPADEETDYKAISAGGGTVTIGMNKEVTKANGEDVKIVGNIYATGTVNLGLGSGQSALKGVIENSDGTTKLFMENGASWNNVMVGHPGAFSGSHLTSINAGSSADTAGNIFQNDGNTLTIDNYSGYANIYYAHTSDGTEAADYAAGDTVIKKAASGSAVNMITANNGINMQDTDKVADALNALAGKLTYSGFASGEKNLTGKVKIADGLTASSAVLKTGDITFADDTGKGTYVKPVVPIEPKSEFSTAITGDKAVDTEYVHAGVLDDSNIYNFTEDKTTIDVETGYSIPGGPWMSKITALVSGKDDSHSVDVNMNGHDLTLRSSNSTVGIAAIGKGKVEVNNAGAIDIDVDTSGRAALYANGGGTIVVHNGGDNLENKVLKVRAEGSTPLNTAVIKTMNGVNNVHSSITIDGLVDVVADGETANEAVSAVASNIEIGGGHIEAKNGAWAAIRAYGEFVSQNYGIVNVNVAKDQNGNIIGSGENKTTIIGDIVTNGGMGTKGKISVGLNGKDSYWKGNYADTRGYGVTPGIEGAVNLYMENGSHWLGFGNGTMNVNMSGKDTYWTGFSIARNNGLRLTLNDGAVWYNAFSKGQTDKDGNLTVSRVTNLSGNGGIIDMSGSKGIYVADSTSLSGSPTKAGASGFAKDDSKTETGNAFIEKYSGNHTVIYKDNSFIDNTEREHALLYGNKEAHIAGGTFTIFKADAGSAITLLTGNNGINTSADATYVEKNQLNDTLNKLAEKLFYTANDGNLSGKVGIASGLTSSAAYAVVKSGDITFKDKGQGSYVYDLVKPSEQAVNPIDKVIDGSKDSQNYYEDIGIYNKNKNSYNFTKTPSDITASDKTDGVVHAKDGNLNIKANDTINISAGDNGVGVAAENGKKVILSGITNITASKALDANGEESAINMEAGHVRGTVTAENGGKITMDGAEVTGDITVADEKSSLNGTFKGGNGIQGKVTNNGEAVLTFTEGANWTGNSAGTGSTNVDIDKGSVWTGASANKGTNLDLKGTWKQTGESAVGQVISDNGTLDKTDSSSGKTSIQKLSGELNVTYGHNESDPTRIIGGDTVVASAASGSKINLITDSKGLKLDSNRAAAKNQVSETLNQLAHKLTYTADDNNLEGKVKIAEGLTSASAAMKAENITFDKNGVGSFVYDPVKNGLDIEYGSEETQMMRGTKSALFGAAMMWRSNSNDLQRRMGDIRLGQEESGVWAKYIGGKNEFNSQSTYMNQSYDIAQAGYDRKAGDWTVGIALDHGTGDVHYTGGKGDEKMTTLAVYGTKVSDDGKYVDIIIKSGKVSNDFEVSNEIGNELSGDYDTWGSSLSAEFSKRFIKDNGFYLDPSVEFTISRLNGKSFTGHSDLGELAVRQHAFNSAIGRIGLGIGRQTAKSNLYAKASLAHEFGGNFRTDFSADDGGAKGTKIDLQDTWMDLELGGSYSLNKNVYLYANYTRSFGAEMSTEWRADVGVRYSF